MSATTVVDGGLHGFGIDLDELAVRAPVSSEAREAEAASAEIAAVADEPTRFERFKAAAGKVLESIGRHEAQIDY